MSVVAGKVYKEKVVIGADTQTTWGQAVNNSPNAKIFQANKGLVIGTVGAAFEGQLMRLFCDTHTPKSSSEHDIIEFIVEFWGWCKEKRDDFKPDNWFLMAMEGKLISVTNVLDVNYHEYWAIGSGWEYARTSLHLGHTVEESLKVACELTIYCGEPLEIYEVKNK